MEIDIPEYNVNTGLRLCWSDGYSIKISTNDNEVIISANREGLLSLANHLLIWHRLRCLVAHISIWTNTMRWKMAQAL